MAFGDIDITPGAGASVHVDTVTGAGFQRVKLVDGTEGGTQGIPGSTASGLLTSSAAQGAIADVAVTNPASSGSIIALLKGLLTQLATSATGLLKLEDAAHASGDAGVQILAVRTDTQATLSSTTGDYTPLQTDSLGALRVVNTAVKAEDAAHVSGDTGMMALAVRRDTAAVSSGTTGDYEPLQTDALGALRTVDAVAVKVGALTNATTTALAASLIVKASAGTLFKVSGYSTTGGFLLIHNTSTVPADAQVPVVSRVVLANSDYDFDFGTYGRAFSTGITVVFSTTGPTKTIGGSAMWIDAQYV